MTHVVEALAVVAMSFLLLTFLAVYWWLDL